jgi:hypothetical protein
MLASLLLRWVASILLALVLDGLPESPKGLIVRAMGRRLPLYL